MTYDESVIPYIRKSMWERVLRKSGKVFPNISSVVWELFLHHHR